LKFKMNQKLIIHFQSSNPEERLKLLLAQTCVVKTSLERREKASNSYLSYSGARTGIRGGRRSTLDANLQRACEYYTEANELLQEYMKIYLK